MFSIRCTRRSSRLMSLQQSHLNYSKIRTYVNNRVYISFQILKKRIGQSWQSCNHVSVHTARQPISISLSFSSLNFYFSAFLSVFQNLQVVYCRQKLYSFEQCLQFLANPAFATPVRPRTDFLYFFAEQLTSFHSVFLSFLGHRYICVIRNNKVLSCRIRSEYSSQFLSEL